MKHHTADNNIAQLEIREHQKKFYAILKQDDETLGVTGAFPTHTAAYLAGQTLLERYQQNRKHSHDL